MGNHFNDHQSSGNIRHTVAPSREFFCGHASGCASSCGSGSLSLDMLNGTPGRSSNDVLLAEALQNRNQSSSHFAEGLDLVRRFSFGLGMGMNMSWEESNALFESIVSTATGIPSDLDWEVWRQNRPYDAWEKSIYDELLELLSHVNTHELMRLTTQLEKEKGTKCEFQPGKHIGEWGGHGLRQLSRLAAISTHAVLSTPHRNTSSARTVHESDRGRAAAPRASA